MKIQDHVPRLVAKLLVPVLLLVATGMTHGAERSGYTVCKKDGDFYVARNCRSFNPRNGTDIVVQSELNTATRPLASSRALRALTREVNGLKRLIASLERELDAIRNERTIDDIECPSRSYFVSSDGDRTGCNLNQLTVRGDGSVMQRGLFNGDDGRQHNASIVSLPPGVDVGQGPLAGRERFTSVDCTGLIYIEPPTEGTIDFEFTYHSRIAAYINDENASVVNTEEEVIPIPQRESRFFTVDQSQTINIPVNSLMLSNGHCIRNLWTTQSVPVHSTTEVQMDGLQPGDLEDYLID